MATFLFLKIFAFILISFLPVQPKSFAVIHDNGNGMDKENFDVEESGFNSTSQNSVKSKNKNNNCKLSINLIAEIASYQLAADLILATILNGPFKGRTYNELSTFINKFGSRFTGTMNLEDSIDYMLRKIESDHLENVRGEDVVVPRWIRGDESAELLSPQRKKLAILGLGYSVGTPKDGITAEVLVVQSYKELKQKADKVEGKIIVFNIHHRNTPDQGTTQVAKLGGVASITRSFTPLANNSPHAVLMSYGKNVTRIPAAAISVLDAQFLQECQDKGLKIVIQLKMNDYMSTPSKSKNVIGEIVGYEIPKEIVIVSGHIDSCDVGVGAMDDGGGAFIAEETAALLKFLNLRPRRTLRSILWTGEEMGTLGAKQYVKRHKKELDNLIAVVESDHGTFEPLGADFAGSQSAGCIVQEILKLLAPINATTFRTFSTERSDVQVFIDKRVPAFNLNTKDGKYYWYHHSTGDTMAVENSDDLDLCLAVWATISYVLSDLSVSLPRK